MGLFSALFKKKKDEKTVEQPQTRSTNTWSKRGNIETNYIRVNPSNIADIKKSYIAIDVETTGLRAETDKIIEVGAVKYENCIEIDSYGTLIKIGSPIPAAATKVNHITDDMLNEQGIDPKVAYNELICFLGNAINGSVYLVAHNANFDMGFLKNTLESYGYSGTLNYVDTLQLSRSNLKDLENHKQPTIAKHFGISNDQEHRAETDARTCGLILGMFLTIIGDYYDKLAKKSSLTPEEKEVAAVILNSLLINGFDISKLRFYRNASGYVDVMQVYTVFKFKVGKNGSYIILNKNTAASLGLEVEDCTKSEGIDNRRLYFKNRQQLEELSFAIVDLYRTFIENIYSQSYTNRYEAEFFANASFTIINESEISDLLDSYSQREIDQANLLKAKEEEKIRAAEQKAAAKLKSEEDKIKKAAEKQKKEEAQKLLQQKCLEQVQEYTDDQIKEFIELSSINKKRSVIQMDDDGHIIKIYISVADASKEVNIAPKTIRDVANGKYKHAAGFCWMYTDTYFD